MTACATIDAVPDGLYRARAVKTGMSKVEFNDGDVIHYVWISFSLLDDPYEGRLFDWRGWLTGGAMHRTAPALVACGARLQDNDPTDLHGIDGNVVNLALRTIDCVEAPGVVKTYISSIQRCASDPIRRERGPGSS